MEEAKTQNPDLTDTQVQQFEKAVSKLDTKDLTQHKDTLVKMINEVSKTKLSFAEKIYTMVTRKYNRMCKKCILYRGVEGVKFVGHNLAGIGYGAAGLCNLVYENLPSHSEVSNIASVLEDSVLELVGNGMLALEYNV